MLKEAEEVDLGAAAGQLVVAVVQEELALLAREEVKEGLEHPQDRAGPP